MTSRGPFRPKTFYDSIRQQVWCEQPGHIKGKQPALAFRTFVIKVSERL